MLSPRLRLASLALLLGAVAVASGCRSGGRERRTGSGPGGEPGPLSLNRGDWLMGRQDGLWKVLEESRTGGAPTHVGYVTSRRYREVRGGPEFTLYEVTTLDLEDVIGMVDSLGNAVRYRWRFNELEKESLGNNTLALDVQAIFDLPRPVTLHATSVRDLAFEHLDVNHDGVLDKTEFPRLNDRVGNPDRNHDGKVDRNEFEDADL